jgi:NADH:ubiquinone oxidoreductase subunit F (NADH-binding)
VQPGSLHGPLHPGGATHYFVIEGMLIVAHAIGTAEDFIDPRAEYLFALKRLHALARASPAYWEKTFGRRYRS